jgi:hypothetical protein
MRKALDKMALSMMSKWNRFVQEEEGDTNFISIIVILGIVMVLVGVFAAFKDQIIEAASDLINNNLAAIH